MHPAARGFAHVAATYERGRPDYPHELLDWLRSRVLLAEGRVVIDLGAGTGKLARLLVGHGARVLAVEPLEEMRAELEAVVPQAEVVAGSAEAIPLGDAMADLVTCGQSFHWFANEVALGEIARVLRPGGALVLIWNMRDSSDELQQRLGAILDARRGETPTYASGEWRAVMDRSARFIPDGELAVRTEQVVDRAGLLDRVESTSFVAGLAGPERAQLLAEVASLVASTGRVSLRYVTEAHAYRLDDAKIAP
jgi:SAM-dependent methyltransferase